MTAADPVTAYHELSKHRPDRYAPGPGGLDWANQPDPFRTFGGAAKRPLPLLPGELDVSFAALRRPGAVAPRPLDLDSLAALLQLSLGLSAWKAHGGNRWALRCNPSSGNLHPTEGYLVCPDLPGIAAGVYHYLSRDHLLEQRAIPAQPAWRQAFPAGGVLLGLSGIHWREAWKYGVRAWRYCQHDCGHAMAAVRYAAAALGWRARLLDGWGDGDIARLLGLDRTADFDGAGHEAPEVVLWVGPETAEPGPGDLLAALEQACWQGRANRLSPDRVHWPAIDHVAQAVRKPTTAPLATVAPATLPELPAPGRDLPASTLFRQRRSATDFDGHTAMAAADFFTLLDALLPRPGVPPWDALPWPPGVHAAIFVHRVAGLSPGLYLLARDPTALPQLKPALRRDWLWQPVPGCPSHLPLSLLLPYDLADAARGVACQQEIAADSAFSLGMIAEFDAVLAQGPWWYRRLHWEAGMLGHVLYLEAEAAGVRGTGIGCFFDDEMHGLLGIENRSFQDLYHFTVGTPVEDPRLTTLPPYQHLTGR